MRILQYVANLLGNVIGMQTYQGQITLKTQIIA